MQACHLSTVKLNLMIARNKTSTLSGDHLYCFYSAFARLIHHKNGFIGQRRNLNKTSYVTLFVKIYMYIYIYIYIYIYEIREQRNEAYR